jgi:hypothetical protein
LQEGRERSDESWKAKETKSEKYRAHGKEKVKEKIQRNS